MGTQVLLAIIPVNIGLGRGRFDSTGEERRGADQMPDLIASRDYLRICIPVYLIKVALARAPGIGIVRFRPS